LKQDYETEVIADAPFATLVLPIESTRAAAGMALDREDVRKQLLSYAMHLEPVLEEAIGPICAKIFVSEAETSCMLAFYRLAPPDAGPHLANDTVSELVAEAVEATFQEAEELRKHVTHDDIDFLLDGVGENRGDDYLGVAAIQTVRKVVRFLENPNILPAELRIGGQIASIIPREPLSYRRLAETPLLISGRVLCVDDAKRLTKIASEDPGYGMEIGFRGGHRRTLVRAQLDNAVVKLSYLPRLDLFTRELETNQGELVEILSISGAASSKT
jgi:hypothetical protein